MSNSQKDVLVIIKSDEENKSQEKNSLFNLSQLPDTPDITPQTPTISKEKKRNRNKEEKIIGQYVSLKYITYSH